MIFLFVAGERYAYMDSILATLHLPAGMVYRYKYSQDRVDGSAGKENCRIDEKTVISYIDRRAGDCTCTFLRMGSLVAVAGQDGLLHYAVKLEEYGETKNERAYGGFLKSCFEERMYHMNPQGYSEGMLALRLEDNVWAMYGQEYIGNTEEAWIKTAKTLAGKELFRENYTIFTRLSVVCLGKGRKEDVLGDMPEESAEAARVFVEDGEWGYLLKEGDKYRLVLSYYIDQYNDNPMTDIHVHWEDSGGFCGLSWKNFEMGSRQDIYATTLCPQGNGKQAASNLRLRIDEGSLCGKRVVYFQKPLRMLVENPFSWAKTVGTILLLVLMAVCTYTASMPFGEMFSKYAAGISGSLVQATGWQQVMYQAVLFFGADGLGDFCSAMASLAGAVVTFFLVKLCGSANPLP